MKHLPISESPKSALRKQAIALRSTLPIPEISQTIQERLIRLTQFQRAGRVLIYHPFRQELNFLPLAAQFPEKQWFLPAVEAGEKMAFHPYHPSHSLNEGHYGIHEPLKTDKSNRVTPAELRPEDVMILPGLLFDRAGYRIGYGKGYFDRFLGQAQTLQTSCVTIGAVPSALLKESLPIDPWDLPAQWILTEFDTLEVPNQ